MKRFFGFVFVLVAMATMSFGQAISVNGGSIQGTVTDPSGAVVSGASIRVTSVDQGSVKSVKADSAGIYAVGPLNPGSYSVSISAPGFENLLVNTVVRTGTVTNGNFKLTLGKSSETVEVNAGALQVNTDQAGVSDVITSEQIKSLPVNGRNFLDLAQIEPGVILQSGESFDPTKAGYSAISVGGVSGRTTRILLDGQDITDEYVGTTIFNVSQGAISEFQLNRSTQDVSGEVTSTGQVLVSTNSGTNAFHGQLFYNFQDHRALFARSQNGQDPQFQRNQFGGSIGGPIIKDKLFFFANVERIKQDSSSVSPVHTGDGALFSDIFDAFPTIPSPYRLTYSTARVDYNGPFGGHYFARVNYDVDSVSSNFGDGYWIYANRDNTPGYAFGADFQNGHFTHSFRGSYEKFHNMIVDKTTGDTSIYNGIPGFAFYNSSQGLFSGPNDNAPQQTFLSDKQFRYDGTWTKAKHNFKYGYSLNRIQGGGFASFFGIGPRGSESNATRLANCGGNPGAGPCPNDPINGYHVNTLYLGNGLGSSTETPGFGLAGGGVADWREGAYFSDNWKLSPKFTLTAGVRWSVDTGRANQDLSTPLCNTIDSTQVAPACSGSSSIFAQFNPAYGKNVHQPYGNFGPQVGFNYSPNHNMVVHAGFGIFYEGDVFNNTSNARTNLLQTGAFLVYNPYCSNGVYSVPFADGTSVSSVNGVSIQSLCSAPLSVSGPAFITLEQQFQAAAKANPLSANSTYVGNTLTVNNIYGAPYRTPYSEQWNAGFQQALFKGALVTIDYIHNSTLKIGQQVDQNHVGAARYLNATAAQNAIAATTAGFGCAGGYSSTAITCAIAAGALITDFASNGLDSGNQYLGGSPASYVGNGSLTPATGAAFPGANPALGNGNFIIPIGRSGYDALQVVYKQVTAHPVRGVENMNLQVAYNLSRIVSSSNNSTGDQFFSGLSYDNDNPNAYMGRSGLDRTNQLSMGGAFTVKYGPTIGLIGHFYSALPTTLILDDQTPTAGIFQSDVTGDGSIGDLAPGTLPGAYMHGVKPTTLGKYINNFNATQAGKLTPAGNALVTAGLFTPDQLTALGGTIQPIAYPSADQGS